MVFVVGFFICCQSLIQRSSAFQLVNLPVVFGCYNYRFVTSRNQTPNEGVDYLSKLDICTLSKKEVEDFIASLSLPPFRSNQLIHWIYEKRVNQIDDITEFSKKLREKLSTLAYIGKPEIRNKVVSSDGTIKYLFGLKDGHSIESVLIPDEKRLTLCISSQVGCAMGCKFCRTSPLGLKRNLTASEITGQIIAVSGDRTCPGPITNIVLMGMGEPLNNFNEVTESLTRMTTLLGISKRRITVSTCGIVPKIRKLFSKSPEVNLAVSLNAATDQVREEIMPINKIHNLASLLKACKTLSMSPRRRITFEYILLKGVNDSVEDALKLKKILKGIPSKINLIPFNSFDGAAFRPSDHDRILTFQQILQENNITAFIRKSKGRDILAACGQLAGECETLSKQFTPKV